MAKPAQFAYTSFADAQGTVLLRPLIPISLTYNAQTTTAEALLDTGAAVNLLPHDLGQQLGLNWDEARPIAGVSDNLSQAEARAVIVDTLIGPFAPVRLLFIWVKSDATRLLLGQINFFQKFNVCFFGFDSLFEVYPRE